MPLRASFFCAALPLTVVLCAISTACGSSPSSAESVGTGESDLGGKAPPVSIAKLPKGTLDLTFTVDVPASRSPICVSEACVDGDHTPECTESTTGGWLTQTYEVVGTNPGHVEVHFQAGSAAAVATVAANGTWRWTGGLLPNGYHSYWDTLEYKGSFDGTSMKLFFQENVHAWQDQTAPDNTIATLTTTSCNMIADVAKAPDAGTGTVGWTSGLPVGTVSLTYEVAQPDCHWEFPSSTGSMADSQSIQLLGKNPGSLHVHIPRVNEDAPVAADGTWSWSTTTPNQFAYSGSIQGRVMHLSYLYDQTGGMFEECRKMTGTAK